MTYDPAAYWRKRGATYRATFRPERYVEQERALTAVLEGLEFATVLEVGCGFGRIGRLIRDVRPEAHYTGIDLSPAMLDGARELLPDAELVATSIADFNPADRRWDLVIAAEVLMHVPPPAVKAAVRKLTRLSSRNVVTVDWTVPLVGRTPSPHNFLHPYQVLLGSAPFGRTRPVDVVPVGLQAIHSIRVATG